MKEIVIKGSIDELVECEFYLVMVMGYKNNREEKWNNKVLSNGYMIDRIIAGYLKNTVEYHFHPRDNSGISAQQFLSQFK